MRSTRVVIEVCGRSCSICRSCFKDLHDDDDGDDDGDNDYDDGGDDDYDDCYDDNDRMMMM
jgi:hypothetical protein